MRTSVDIRSLEDLLEKVGEMYEICIEERWVCEWYQTMECRYKFGRTK